jgi:hypothetical protein
MSRPSAAIAADHARYGPPASDERATQGETAILQLDDVILTIETRAATDGIVMAVLTHRGFAKGGRGAPSVVGRNRGRGTRHAAGPPAANPRLYGAGHVEARVAADGIVAAVLTHRE